MLFFLLSDRIPMSPAQYLDECDSTKGVLVSNVESALTTSNRGATSKARCLSLYRPPRFGELPFSRPPIFFDSPTRNVRAADPRTLVPV